jgi:hypothetical protein
MSLLVTGILSVVGAPSAGAWAPAATAPIHPGVQLFTNGAQCTANFIYSDGGSVYIGQAAHCSGTGGNTATNGCTSGTLPLGTPVTITGTSRPGSLAYSSWVTMQQLGEADPNTCQFNDLELVQIDPADVGSVNPSVPFYGGPTGVKLGGTSTGDNVYSYGNSELRLGVRQLSPKRGVSIGDNGGGWSHDVYTVTPGIPGDSGSGFLDANGAAMGVLSTVQIAPLAGSNGVGDLGRELDYMHAHGGPMAGLVNGTEPFSVRLAPLARKQLGSFPTSPALPRR